MKKIREKIQKFRVSEKGFTLIELIVVIAIIGILAAIGAVAYSGYIESANQAADEQLLYDVSYAIQLGAADEGLTGEDDYGYVTIGADGMNVYMTDEDGNDVLVAGIDYTGDDDEEDPTVSYSDSISYYAQALVTDFGSLTVETAGDLAVQWLEDGVGSDWETQGFQSDYYGTAEGEVMIPSGDWTVSGTTSGLSTTIAANLTNYAASTFAGNEEELMDSVEGVASTFGALLESYATKLSDNTVEAALAYVLGFDLDDEEDAAAWEEILATYGIELEDGEDLTADEAGNLMVMYMAGLLTDEYSDEDGNISSNAISSLVSNIVSTEDYESEMASILMALMMGGSLDSDTFAELTAYFGVATSYYEYLEDQGITDLAGTTALEDETTNSFILAYEDAISSFTTGDASGYTAALYLCYVVDAMMADIDEENEYYSSGQLATDTTAYMSVLSVLTESYSDGSFNVDLSSMGWDSDAYSYLLELLETYGIDVSE